MAGPEKPDTMEERMLNLSGFPGDVNIETDVENSLDSTMRLGDVNNPGIETLHKAQDTVKSASSAVINTNTTKLPADYPLKD